MKFKFYRSGKVFGIHYFMEENEALPEHRHDDSTLHNIIVLKGSCWYSDTKDSIKLEAGAVFDFDGTQRHFIRACEPTEILNLFLNGEPQGYDTLPPQGIVE